MYSSIQFATFFLTIASMVNLCLSDFYNLYDTCPATQTEKQTFFFNGLPCKNPSTISASDFKSSKLAQPGDTDNFSRSSMNIVTASDFPGLNTLGLSTGRTDLDIDGIVMPHSHPRASEMLFVQKGRVLAGFIDTENRVFQNVLNPGDVTVFPQGLLHFCSNIGFDTATAFSVFNGQNPGTVSISGAMFELDQELRVFSKLTKKLNISFESQNRVSHENLSMKTLFCQNM